jgi:putative nucleotidyltransferase with HDIG domain
LEKLQAMQIHGESGQIVSSSLGAALILMCFFLTIYLVYLNRQNFLDRNHNKNLLFLACVVVTFFFLTKISASLAESITRNTPFSISASSLAWGIPLGSGAMIICLFLGLDIAVPIAIVLAACAAVIFENRFEMFIFFFLNSTMGAYWVRHCRERKVFIKAGVKLGLLNVILVTAIEGYSTGLAGLAILGDWSFAFLGGVAAGVVTAGFAPLVEIAFDYTTDITLLELANLDQPILRRLIIEAPGTYHHSVIVGSMVEAAASEINANPLLAKVCGYYHDIGKIKTPLYFIENQTQGKNKHDKLAPSMSSLILIAHIKNGVEIARENKLGQIIIDTIRQHHGTSLIRFFFDKAKQMKGEGAVKIDDFRYPGPKPQTREAGLVMLADVVEAASRTLENPTPSRLQGLVQQLINRVFSDGQLDNCELTLKDLNNIAKSFNKILNGIHHHRIEYSETSAAGNGKGKNGSPDRQQANPLQVVSEDDSESGSNRLKRLGLS